MLRPELALEALGPRLSRLRLRGLGHHIGALIVRRGFIGYNYTIARISNRPKAQSLIIKAPTLSFLVLGLALC